MPGEGREQWPPTQLLGRERLFRLHQAGICPMTLPPGPGILCQPFCKQTGPRGKSLTEQPRRSGCIDFLLRCPAASLRCHSHTVPLTHVSHWLPVYPTGPLCSHRDMHTSTWPTSEHLQTAGGTLPPPAIASPAPTRP